jgi:hypothetical protein
VKNVSRTLLYFISNTSLYVVEERQTWETKKDLKERPFEKDFDAQQTNYESSVRIYCSLHVFVV